MNSPHPTNAADACAGQEPLITEAPAGRHVTALLESTGESSKDEFLATEN